MAGVGEGVKYVSQQILQVCVFIFKNTAFVSLFFSEFLKT